MPRRIKLFDTLTIPSAKSIGEVLLYTAGAGLGFNIDEQGQFIHSYWTTGITFGLGLLHKMVSDDFSIARWRAYVKALTGHVAQKIHQVKEEYLYGIAAAALLNYKIGFGIINGRFNGDISAYFDSGDPERIAQLLIGHACISIPAYRMGVQANSMIPSLFKSISKDASAVVKQAKLTFQEMKLSKKDEELYLAAMRNRYYETKNPVLGSPKFLQQKILSLHEQNSLDETVLLELQDINAHMYVPDFIKLEQAYYHKVFEKSNDEKNLGTIAILASYEEGKGELNRAAKLFSDIARKKFTEGKLVLKPFAKGRKQVYMTTDPTLSSIELYKEFDHDESELLETEFNRARAHAFAANEKEFGSILPINVIPLPDKQLLGLRAAQGRVLSAAHDRNKLTVVDDYNTIFDAQHFFISVDNEHKFNQKKEPLENKLVVSPLYVKHSSALGNLASFIDEDLSFTFVPGQDLMPANIIKGINGLVFIDKGENSMSPYMFDMWNSIMYNATLSLKEKMDVYVSIARPKYMRMQQVSKEKSDRDFLVSGLARSHRLIALHHADPVHKNLLLQTIDDVQQLIAQGFGNTYVGSQIQSEVLESAKHLLNAS